MTRSLLGHWWCIRRSLGAWRSLLELLPSTSKTREIETRKWIIGSSQSAHSDSCPLAQSDDDLEVPAHERRRSAKPHENRDDHRTGLAVAGRLAADHGKRRERLPPQLLARHARRTFRGPRRYPQD